MTSYMDNFTRKLPLWKGVLKPSIRNWTVGYESFNFVSQKTITSILPGIIDLIASNLDVIELISSYPTITLW